jgi:lysophospholipid acyltransferase
LQRVRKYPNQATQKRRYFRPFFVDNTGKATPLKPYYDAFTWLVTQAAFSFTTTPFLTLTFSNSIIAWTRVYLYAIIGVALSYGFFASPAKAFLVRELKKRNPENAANGKDAKAERPAVTRSDSGEKADMRTTLGVPNDPELEVDDILREVKKEIEARKRKGLKVDAREVMKEKLQAAKGA